MKAINLKTVTKSYNELRDAKIGHGTAYRTMQEHRDNPYYQTRATEAWNRLKAVEAEYRTAAHDIDTAIDAIEGRSTARTVSAADIIDDVIEIINRLDIPKKAIVGTVATIDHNAQKFPSAYRYVPMSTVVTVEFDKSGNPRLTDIRRDRCVTNKYTLTLSDTAKAALLSKAARLWQ